MLNDNVINVFQNLIKADKEDVNCLQDTLLGTTPAGFNVIKSKPFMQILHDGKLHWLLISTYGCKQGEVFLMDSLFHGRVAEETKRQICSIMRRKSR